MFEKFKAIVEALKLGVSYWVGGTMVCGIMLFSPSGWVTALNLEAARNQCGAYLGLGFLVCSIVVVIRAGDWLIGQMRERRWLTQQCKMLALLTKEEKRVLAGYVLKGSKTQYFNVGDGIVRGLERSGIIFRSSSIGASLSFSFNIQPWAWDALQENPESILGDIVDDSGRITTYNGEQFQKLSPRAAT